MIRDLRGEYLKYFGGQYPQTMEKIKSDKNMPLMASDTPTYIGYIA